MVGYEYDMKHDSTWSLYVLKYRYICRKIILHESVIIVLNYIVFNQGTTRILEKVLFFVLKGIADILKEKWNSNNTNHDFN